MHGVDQARWVTSTRCATSTCVEVSKVGDQYLIRDSKYPGVAPLAFTTEEWTAFVEGVNAGEFRF
ncbi:DUF397 domain-containing protein [Jidongwangia harbinensis]|uniref:DUF397 domain-containing protein n=1 Tax=Jidongwangia harbinensis TaxID=2878561 RepID=UPI001CDA321F|nr:DUF397 domain-containing protein [Jidongwangia harbinensis]MCA2214538.1 DUF397 domain-containing protein [Jidongwangia harbinensis]